MKKAIILLSMYLIVASSYGQTYTFTGNGLWSQYNNWVNSNPPPATLPGGDTIIVSPQPGDSCVLNISQIIGPGGNLTISPGARFIVQGNLLQNTNLQTIPSVTICGREWMVKNLNVSTFRNGDTIPYLPTEGSCIFYDHTKPSYCYNRYDPSYDSIYGKLYSWGAVIDPRGLAPAGWHIPSLTEWDDLITCLGGYDVAGTAMKSTTGGWSVGYPLYITNSSGLSCLPGGYTTTCGSFYSTSFADFWINAESPGSPFAAGIELYNASNGVFQRGYSYGIHASTLLSIRCVKDY